MFFPFHLPYTIPKFYQYYKIYCANIFIGVFPGGTVVKNLPANAGDLGSIPGSGRSPGGGYGNPFQDSCLKNPMNGGAWQATVQLVTKGQTQLSTIGLDVVSLMYLNTFPPAYTHTNTVGLMLPLFFISSLTCFMWLIKRYLYCLAPQQVSG